MCPANSYASNGQCVANFSCNADSSCSKCGSGLNYIYAPTASGGECAPCPDIPNCIQCDTVVNTKCKICANEYYVEAAGTCAACHSNCTSCESNTICTGCKPGWTLKKGQTEGRCNPCVSPCATCKGKPNYCTSCVAGFTRMGWKCRNNTGTQFRLVFSALPSTILADIDNIACGIIAALNAYNVTNASCDQS